MVFRCNECSHVFDHSIHATCPQCGDDWTSEEYHTALLNYDGQGYIFPEESRYNLDDEE